MVGDEKQLGPVCEARRNLFLGAFLLCFWVGKQMQKEIEVSQKNMLIFFSLLLQTSACDDLDFVAKLELDEVLPTEFLERLRLLLPDGPANR